MIIIRFRSNSSIFWIAYLTLLSASWTWNLEMRNTIVFFFPCVSNWRNNPIYSRFRTRLWRIYHRVDSEHQFLIVMCFFKCRLGSNMLSSAQKTDFKKTSNCCFEGGEQGKWRGFLKTQMEETTNIEIKDKNLCELLLSAWQDVV